MNEILTVASYQDVTKAAIGSFANFEDDQTYLDLVQATRQSLEGMDDNAKLAVEAAYVFSRKVPHSERQDMFQELTTAILASGTTDAAFAYTIARRDWQNWWQKYKLHSQYCQGYLSETITDADGEETELAELLVGEIEFERKQIDHLDTKRLWQRLPADIKPLILKRLQGKPLGAPRRRKAGKPKSSGTLNNTERQRLNRWVKTEGYKLIIN